MPKEMTQIKFTIESDTVTKFKSRCEDEGVSMASVIREFMQASFKASFEVSQVTKSVKIKTANRAMRKKSVQEIIGLLNDIYSMEEQYRDSIPEHFTQRYEVADHVCEQLSEAISCLEAAFD